MSRYNNESWLNEQKRIWQHLLVNDKKPWTPEQDDQLLECYLVKRLVAFYGEHESYAKHTGRCFRAVDTRIWKLISRYPGCHYVRGAGRTDRTELPFDDRDLIVFNCLFNTSSIENDALTVEHMSNLLARDAAEVIKWALTRASSHKGFGGRRRTDESDWEWATRLISNGIKAGRINLDFSLGVE